MRESPSPGRSGSTEIRVAELARIPLFEGLSKSHLERLRAITAARRYAPGETIFSEGDVAAGIHIVRNGRVKVYKLSPDGKEQILHVWSGGEPFGEVAVLQGDRYPAHAEALEEAAVLFVPRSGLLDLIRSDPEFALALLAVLADRLRRLADLVESVSLKEVPSRLAAYLLSLQEDARGTVELPIAKRQLANQLGTIPETLSRAIARLARARLIESAGARSLRILDRAGLERAASGTGRTGPAGGAGKPGG